MASAYSKYNSSVFFDANMTYPDKRTIACYEQELANHKLEQASLRGALARAEAFILETETSTENVVRSAEWRDDCANQIAKLTPRQNEIMKMVLAGYPSKNIAADLGISQRTVENHRAAIMKKTGSKSLPALGRFGFTAAHALQASA